MKLHNILILTALAVAPACSKSPEEKLVSLMEDLGAAAEGAGSDCAKMAKDTDAVVSKYDIASLKGDAQKMKADKDKSAEMKKKYGDRIEKAMPGVMAMTKCAGDPQMKAVNDKLKEMM